MRYFIIGIILLIGLAAQIVTAQVIRDLADRALSGPRPFRSDIELNPPDPPDPPDPYGCENCTQLEVDEVVPANTDLTIAGVCHRSSTHDISVSSSEDGAFTRYSADANEVTGTAPTVRAAIYRLIAPTAGAQTFTVSATAAQNMAFGIFHFQDVDGTTPLGTISASFGTGTTPSTMISSATQRIVFDHLCTTVPNNETIAPGAGQGSLWQKSAGVNASLTNRQSGASTKAGAASVTMTWDKPDARAYVHQVVDIRPPDDTDPPPTSDNITHTANFETGTVLSGADPDLIDANGCCAHSHALSSAQANDGTQSVRFESSDGDPVSGNTPGKTMLGWNATQTNGTERWYGFAIYFDSTWDDNTNDPNGTIVYQWHRTNDACDTFTGQHLAFRVLPNDNLLAVNFADGTTGCNTNSTVTETSYNLGAIAKGQWTKFVVHVIWSTGSGGVPTGLLEIWKNGSKVVTQNGPNMVCDGTFPACNKSSIVRFGIYKSWWNLQNPNPDDTLIHYMDSIKIGDENASFNEVSPP